VQSSLNFKLAIAFLIAASLSPKFDPNPINMFLFRVRFEITDTHFTLAGNSASGFLIVISTSPALAYLFKTPKHSLSASVSIKSNEVFLVNPLMVLHTSA